jgi:hypothetical protein
MVNYGLQRTSLMSCPLIDKQIPQHISVWLFVHQIVALRNS